MRGKKRLYNILDQEPDVQNKISKTDSFILLMKEETQDWESEQVMKPAWKLKSKLIDFTKYFKMKDEHLRKRMAEAQDLLQTSSAEFFITFLKVGEEIGSFCRDTFFTSGIDRLRAAARLHSENCLQYQEILFRRGRNDSFYAPVDTDFDEFSKKLAPHKYSEWLSHQILVDVKELVTSVKSLIEEISNFMELEKSVPMFCTCNNCKN